MKLYNFNDMLRNNQYDEIFLIKNRHKYDLYVCLYSQNNISPYFCFKYLYDFNEKYDDFSDNWVSYDDIINKFSKTFSVDFLENEFIKSKECV